MTKEKAIEILNETYDGFLIAEKVCSDAFKDEITDRKIALLTAIDVLKQSSTVEAEPENGWISVKDRLPDDDTLVLVYSRQGNYMNLKVDYIHGGKWFNSMLVTHWMPLPTPPKEVDTE